MHRASTIVLYSEQHHADVAAGRAAALKACRGQADAETLVTLARLAGALRAEPRPAVVAKVAGVSAGFAQSVLMVMGRRRGGSCFREADRATGRGARGGLTSAVDRRACENA